MRRMLLRFLSTAVGIAFTLPPLAMATPAIVTVSVADQDHQTESLPGGHIEEAIGSDPGSGFVRLKGHVLGGLKNAKNVDQAKADAPLTLTVTLQRDDREGFDRYLHGVYDPKSETYRNFLTQAQITKRFGPSRQAYSQVLVYLRHHGFRLIEGSMNRLTLTVRGSRSDAEKTFLTAIDDVEISGLSLYANRSDPAVPKALAAHIQSIVGLSSAPALRSAFNEDYLARLTVAIYRAYYASVNQLLAFEGSGAMGAALDAELAPLINEARAAQAALTAIYEEGVALDAAGLLGVPPTSGPRVQKVKTLAGTGQKIGVVATSSFQMSDVSMWLQAIGLQPSLTSQVSVVNVGGGAPVSSGETDALVAVDTLLNLVPGASIAVFEAPFSANAASFTSVLNAMINDGVTVISNTSLYCEDQTTAADLGSLDAALATAAASGITVLSATGDGGSTCVDGTANTIAVPTDSPHVTAVGGSSGIIAPGNTYGGSSWWDGSQGTPLTGQGGYGVSQFFARPDYQQGLITPAMRSVPDVVALADPTLGFPICQSDAGGCPTNFNVGGTSLATPLMAAYVAAFNQQSGKPLGLLNSSIYATVPAATFHSASEMGTDAAHVGLGAPSVPQLYLALTGQTAGVPTAANSSLTISLQPELPFQGIVTADGKSTATVRVQLRDANQFPVSGKAVSLTAANGSPTITALSATSTKYDGAAIFQITDSAVETVSLTATDTTDGVTLGKGASIQFIGPPAASGGISVNPPNVPADGTTPATVTVTLKDANNHAAAQKLVTLATGGAHVVLSSPTSGVTDVNGQVQFSAIDSVNETVNITATDVTDNLPVPGTGTVSYSGSAASACNLNTVPTAGTNYSIAPYLTGAPAAPTFYYGNTNIGCPGIDNPVFAPGGAVLVSDFLTGSIYRLDLSGGALSSANLLTTISPALGGLVYGKDGSLYATLGNEGAQIIQIDPNSGAVLRVVASGLTCPAGLSVDPLSGDLFFDDQCTGGGTDNASVFRVIDPANTNPANPTSVVVYATLPTTPNGGMAFAPNGTLYAVSGYYGNPNAPVVQVSGTNSASVTVTPLTGITSDYAVAMGVANSDGSAQSLIVEPSGTLSVVPIAVPANATVLGTGSPGVGVTGPDGCLYTQHYDTVYRLASSSGTCQFTPTSPAPSLYITPAAVTPNSVQGGTQTFTATIHNITPLAGTFVKLFIQGTNTGVQFVNTDANGVASFSYQGIHAGVDSISAQTTTATGIVVNSNKVAVTWVAGTHVTAVSLNTSPQAGAVGRPVNVVASLTDLSADPAATLAGQPITFALDGGSCTATTDSAGIATCPLTPLTAGTDTLTASFAASGNFAAASQKLAFMTSPPRSPPPTVTLSVNPSTIAAGSSAKLSWSSTNATTCSASGSWTGTQATGGAETVTPPVAGTLSYVLSCSGPGGTAGATAVLSATLVAVTVTAKSGGGALGWSALGLLSVMVLLKAAAARSPRALRRGSSLAALFAITAFAAFHPAHADDGTTDSTSPYYVGVRVGDMPVRQNAGKIDQGLAERGFENVEAFSNTAGPAGTVFLGYELTPQTAVELAYTYREATAAHLYGTIPSNASLTPLLQSTAAAIRGYGSIVSLSYAGRFEVVPRFSIEPRLGGFFWATSVSAIALNDRIDTTHEGGGVTAGVSAAYRVWSKLDMGVSADHYRGFPSNIATLYGVTLEWRFGAPAN